MNRSVSPAISPALCALSPCELSRCELSMLRTLQRFPLFTIRGNRPKEKYLHGSAQVLMTLGIPPAHRKRMHSRAPPKKPAGKDSGIVQHQAVARPQKLRQVAEHAILPAPFVAMEHQHARSRAVLKRRLRDQLRRKFIIEVGK